MSTRAGGGAVRQTRRGCPGRRECRVSPGRTPAAACRGRRFLKCRVSDFDDWLSRKGSKLTIFQVLEGHRNSLREGRHVDVESCRDLSKVLFVRRCSCEIGAMRLAETGQGRCKSIRNPLFFGGETAKRLTSGWRRRFPSTSAHHTIRSETSSGIAPRVAPQVCRANHRSALTTCCFCLRFLGSVSCSPPHYFATCLFCTRHLHVSPANSAFVFNGRLTQKLS